jgi:hypothetical protein
MNHRLLRHPGGRFRVRPLVDAQVHLDLEPAKLADQRLGFPGQLLVLALQRAKPLINPM